MQRSPALVFRYSLSGMAPVDWILLILLVTPVTYSFSGRFRFKQYLGTIIFPGEDRIPVPSPIKPKCTKAEIESNFCNEVENYPEKLLEDILRAEKYEQVFGDDLLPNENLTRRFDDGQVQHPLCECRERVIYPQAGITRTNVWSIIINQEKYTQGIRVEECVRPNRPCNLATTFPLGVRTECQQKYIYRQLLSLNAKGVVVKDFFRLPSCCMCVLYYDT